MLKLQGGQMAEAISCAESKSSISKYLFDCTFV